MQERSRTHLKDASIGERRVAILAHGRLLKEDAGRLRVEECGELVGRQPLLGDVDHAARLGLTPVGADNVQRSLAGEDGRIVRAEQQPR